MAEINISLKLNAIGVKEAEKSAKATADSYAAAAISSKGIGKSIPTSTGSAAGAAGASGAINKAEGTGYANQRGIIGTGAESRDFAKQAQGLGGLVHVYATFAANLFAVSAAFTALKAAADTANMIKGLDQLSAQSGVALGSVAKALVATTDGAINLREAMTAVAQSSAAGMSPDNIIRMGEAAKKASQALGIAMPDALSRISRGITKLEPELLDELGIFVRVDTAATNYARTLGKTASALTDAEKRKGFAIEVLTQAETKFNSIKLDANPYDKLLASMTNLATVGLNVINNVFGPIAKFLADSPTGLAVAMAAVASVLLKQAVPAFGKFREASQLAARDAAELAVNRSAAANAYGVGSVQKTAFANNKIELDAVRARIAEEKALTDDLATKKNQIAKDAAARIQGLEIDYGKKTRTILAKDASEWSDKELKLAESQANRLTNSADIEAKKKGVILAKQVSLVKDYRTAEESYRNSEIASRQSEYEATQRKISLDAQAVSLRAGYFTIEGALQRSAQKALADAQSKQISAAASEITRVEGIRSAYVKLNTQIAVARAGPTVNSDGIDVAKMTAFNAGWTRTAGLINIATTAVSAFSGVLSSVLFVFGILAVGFQVLDKIFGTAKEEAKKFDSAVLGAIDAAENLDKVLGAIKEKKIENIFSIESIVATTTALDNIVISLGKVATAAKTTAKAQGFFTQIQDRISRITPNQANSYSSDDLAKSLAKETIAALKALEDGPAKKQATESFKKLFSIDPSTLNYEQLQSQLSKVDFGELSNKAVDFAESLKKAGIGSTTTADRLVALRDGIKETAKEIDSYNASFTLSDPLGKIGASLLKRSTDLSAALEDPKTAILALKQVAESTQLLSILPENLATRLISDKNEITSVTTEIGNLEEKIKAMKTALIDPKNADSTGYISGAISAATITLETFKNKASGLVGSYSKELSTAIFTAGAEKIEASLKNAATAAGLTIQKANVSLISMAGGFTGKSEGKIAEAEIQGKITLVKQLQQSIIATERNTIQIERNSLLKDIGNKYEALKVLPTGSTESGEVATKLLALLEQLKVSDVKTKTLSGGSPTLGNLKDLQKGNSNEKQAATELTSFITRMAGTNAELISLTAALSGAKKATEAKGMIDEMNVANQKIDREYVTPAKDKITKIDETMAVEKVYNSNLAIQKRRLEVELAINEAAKDRNKIRADMNILSIAEAVTDGERLDKNNAYLKLNQSLKDLETKNLNDQIKANNVFISAKEKGESDIVSAKLSSDIKLKASENDKAKIALDSEEAILKAKIDNGYITKATSDAAQTTIDKARLALDIDNQILVTKQKQLDIDREKREINLLKEANPGVDMSSRTSANADASGVLTAEIEAQTALNDAKAAGIVLTETQNEKTQQTLDLNATLVTAKESLAAIFNTMATSGTDALGAWTRAAGEMGTNAGVVIDALATMAVNQGKYTEQVENARTAMAGAYMSGTIQEQEKAEINLAKVKRQTTMSQISDVGSLVGATKNMFDKESKGHKALAAVEKGIHLVKMGMMAYELITDIANTAKSLALSGTRKASTIVEAGVDAVGAVIKAIASLGFPFSLIAGAAVGAVVFGLLASIGGSKKERPAPPAAIPDIPESSGGGGGGGGGGGNTNHVKNLQEKFDFSDSYAKMGIAVSFTNTTLIASLSDLAGGLDKFLTQAKFFFDNFYTEAEKLVINQDNVMGSLIDLGMSATTTKDQFKSAVLDAGNDTSEAGQQLYSSLMKLAPAFIEVSNALDKIADKANTLQGQIYSLTGDDASALSVTRAKTLKDIDPSLIAMQKYVFALEDLKKAEKTFTEANKKELNLQKTSANGLISSLKSTISTLEGLKKSINNFANTLLLDNTLSTLTPAEKYAEARDQYSATITAATTTGTSDIEITSRNAALAKVEAVSRALLSASQQYNASSIQYTNDFNMVQAALTSTAAAIDTQITAAQAALLVAEDTKTSIDAAVLALDTVSANILSVADASAAVTDARNLAAAAEQTMIQYKLDYQASISERIAILSADSPYRVTENASRNAAMLEAKLADISAAVSGGSANVENAVNKVKDAVLDTNSSSKKGIGAKVDGFMEKIKAPHTLFKFAEGGLAPTGTHIVGELGPELVDFNTPGRVYTAQETFGMFNGNAANDDLVNEVRGLRSEIKGLRMQQQTETGHLITAQYDAQGRNADVIAQTVEETTQKQIWSAKVQQAVKIA